MKVITGKVVSNKMKNTIVVQIERLQLHPLYKKYMKKFTRLKAHNEDPNLKVGDEVTLVETRPISKEKHFKVVKDSK